MTADGHSMASTAQRRLSSRLSFFYKYVFAPVWITGFGAGTIAVLLKGDSFRSLPARLPFAFFWFAGTLFIYWACARLKSVSLSGSELLVSNYFDTVRIALADVSDISATRMLSPEHIRVTAKTTGSKRYQFIFMPPIRLSLGFTEHPLASELRSMVDAARRARGPQSAA